MFCLQHAMSFYIYCSEFILSFEFVNNSFWFFIRLQCLLAGELLHRIIT